MYRIQITYSGPVPGSQNMRQREWNNVVREAWRQVGLYWVNTYRPKHFTVAGAKEYGYDPRKGERGNLGPKGFKRSYTGRKLAKWGHTRPLVWSGRSEQATRAARIHATATRNKSGVEIFMNAPTLNLKNPHSQINMRAEMTRISPRETVELVRLHRRTSEALLRAIKTKTTVDT